ncbi:MAG: transporter substrate-binding domain-containing protein [Gammaproteobacteria bacterium]|nr:transporter substrate-binding domain-containing protein [Gammaproteobacteria bacterium]
MKYSNYQILILIFTLFCINVSFAEQLLLTEEEKKWLQQHPVIRIAFDKNSPPFEWQNQKGIYQGISVDMIGLIEKQLNIKFERVESKNWTKILEDFKAGKIDVLPAIAKNEKKELFMNFTKTHISVPGVIISSKKFSGISDLYGKKVGVVRDYIWDDIVSEHDDEVDIVRFESTQMGIEMAVLGGIDAMVSDLASVSYIINKEAISNLQVVPVKREQKKNLELATGVRKDWPIFQSILQKAIDSLEQEKTKNIYDKWIQLKKVSFWQASQFRNFVLILVLVIIGIFSLILLWNRSLKLQVARRSEQLDKANNQLIHAEKMESIGRLSAGVAHEVKNPLAILQMSVDYLKGEKNDETISTILDDMDDAIIRADRVIKGLLDFSREKELQVIQGNINEVIEQSLKLVSHELKHRNIQLKTDLSNDLPELGMDRNRLQQVFINLFMNAAHAISSSDNKLSEIYVSSSLSEINDHQLLDDSEGIFHQHEPVLIITILDTGTGLDEKSENEVFEPFFTTKPLGEGTGLGLSVSKTIIGLHHGMITMKNRRDIEKGVEVKIYFVIKGTKST